MHKFTLVHDGSTQGWHATYLAFHITARLGSPLRILHFDLEERQGTLKERAAQVETGARAAGVVFESQLLADFSLGTMKENISTSDGIFLPLRLLPDGKTVSLFLKAFSCTLWVASVEPKTTSMAVLVSDPLKDAHLVSYARILSNRLGQSLVAFIPEEQFESTLKPEMSGLKWRSLQNFSAEQINKALDQLQISLLFLPELSGSLSTKLIYNHVIKPNVKDA